MAYKKFQLEYIFICSIIVLYDMVSTPWGLSDWFADNVTIDKERIFTFRWNKETEQAKIVSGNDLKNIRFHWLSHPDENSYFEFCLTLDELTKDVLLQITDFADSEEEEKELRELWNVSIEKLRKKVGSHS